jgi:outer membrane protein TolC
MFYRVCQRPKAEGKTQNAKHKTQNTGLAVGFRPSALRHGSEPAPSLSRGQALGLRLSAILLPLLITGFAQSNLNLEQSLQLAFRQGPDLASQLTTLGNVKADLAAKEADPSTLIVPLTQARNSAALEQARTDLKRLEVTQSVMAAYLNLLEGQENLKVLEAQVALDSRNFEVAKTKLATKNGTALDVAKAENALETSRQNLSDAKAQIPILSSRLQTPLALNAAVLANAAPAFKEQKIDLAGLEGGLDKRLPSLLQARQSVELAELNVKLSDNDFTPAATLRDYKAQLENAQRTLATGRTNALTSLRDANRQLQAALEKVRIEATDLKNEEQSYAQDQTRFKSGTISRLQLQQGEVALLRARFAYLQAVNAYQKALAALSVAAGVDVAGWTGG